MNSIYQSRVTTLSSLGVKSSLSYQDFERACSGYASMIRFEKDDFLCPNCGHTPKYIVADGKMTGPTKRKVNWFSRRSNYNNIKLFSIQIIFCAHLV